MRGCISSFLGTISEVSMWRREHRKGKDTSPRSALVDADAYAGTADNEVLFAHQIPHEWHS